MEPARRRRRESGLGCSRRLALALRRARRRRRSGAASPRPPCAAPRAPRAEVGLPGRGAAGQPATGGTAKDARSERSGSGPATEESPGERASSRRLPQTWAGLGVGGLLGPDCRTPGAARGDGSVVRDGSFCRVSLCLLLAPGECACGPSAAQAGPGGRGDAREFEPPRAAGSFFRDCAACGGVCEGHSVGLFTRRPLRAHGVVLASGEPGGDAGVCVPSVSLCHRAGAGQSSAPPRQAWQRPCHCGRACPVCAQGLGRRLPDYRKSLSVGVLGECGGVAVVCQWVNVRVHMGR